MQKRRRNNIRVIGSYFVLALFAFMVCGVGVIAYRSEAVPMPDTSIATSTTTIVLENTATTTTPVNTPVETPVTAATLYPNTKPITIGSVTVQASIAQSWVDRIKGLSDTPYLPDDIVKLFLFESSALHGIWMKDMNYDIDIIWVDEALSIVHIEKDVSPDTYPTSFIPDVPARYVIETAAGFVTTHAIKKGDRVVLPKVE